MKSVIYSQRAEKDLLEIWLYIADDDMEAADRQIERIVQSRQTLAQHPGISFARAEIRTGLRSWPVGPYLILHEDDADGLRIVRVIHGARDVDAFHID